MDEESREKKLPRLERAFDAADAAAGADRAAITRAAQADAEEAVKMVGIAIAADEEAAIMAAAEAKKAAAEAAEEETPEAETAEAPVEE